MQDFFPLFSQAGVVAFQAIWLSFATYDNITHSAVNERGFGRVLRMDLVEKQDPEAFKELSGRRVLNPATEMALFKALVAGEAIVAVLLWLGALVLLLSAFGVVGHFRRQGFGDDGCPRLHGNLGQPADRRPVVYGSGRDGQCRHGPLSSAHLGDGDAGVSCAGALMALHVLKVDNDAV